MGLILSAWIPMDVAIMMEVGMTSVVVIPLLSRLVGGEIVGLD